MKIRVVDIVDLDKQADGGTNVARTGEVGRIRITKTESNGKGTTRGWSHPRSSFPRRR